MNRKKLVSVCLVVVMSLVTSLNGCNILNLSTMPPSLHIDRGPFVPFTHVEDEIPSIDNPVQSWTYHWPEDYDRVLEAITEPLVDKDGNVYFLGKNDYFYSIDTNGELIWNDKGYKEPIVVAEEGIVAKNYIKNLNLTDLEKNLKWSTKVCFDGYQDSLYLAPNGYLVYLDFGNIVGLDSQGKTMWVYKNIFVADNCFFDENSNAYITYSYSYNEKSSKYKEGEDNFEYFMMSISPEGELRWRQSICSDRNYIDTFTPKDNRINDVFLLAYSTSSIVLEDHTKWTDWYQGLRQSPKVIKAFNTDGEELWQMREERNGLYRTQYTVGSDNQLYFSFNSSFDDPKEPSSSPPLDNLMCVSKTGEIIWDIPFKEDITTAPSLDSEGNIYVGIMSSHFHNHIYSFFPDGTSRWVLNDIDVASEFKSNLILSPKGKIHFTTVNQSLLFCIEEAQE
jgi:hypothetical protein